MSNDEMTREEQLKKIIQHYGTYHQLKYLQTEFFEFSEAVLSGDKKHIAEELSDVLVMLSQFKSFYNISDEDIEKEMDFKISRQLNRIEYSNDANSKKEGQYAD